MIHQHQLEGLKQFSAMIVDFIPDGVIFAIIHGNEIVWKLPSKKFDLESVQVGSNISELGGAYKAIKEKKEVIQKVPRTVYGTRVIIKSIPILDDLEEVIGAVSILLPRLHPVAHAFPNFAPVIAEMFTDGAFLFMTDMEKYMRRQTSKKFEITTIQLGDKFDQNGIVAETIRNKKPTIKELDADFYGVPTVIMVQPMFDDDGETTGSFGMILPHRLSLDLRNMAAKLSEGMDQIAAAVQQSAGSASHINSNEMILNHNILEVGKLSDDINSVLDFIKQVADQTRMLGLNAAIEAARAGQVGAGFSVVAEEIRKLSDQSKDTVVRIRSLTNDIKGKVQETIRGSEEILSATQEQAAASEEITANVETMTNLAQKLSEIAKNI